MPARALYASGSDGGGTREIFPIEHEPFYQPLIGCVQFVRKEVLEISRHERSQRYFTEPFNSAADMQQNILHFKDTLLSLPGEEPQSRQGEDRRKLVKEQEKWPQRTHGCLALHFNGKMYGGSGVLVGPHHVLTCAHNVYWPKEKAWSNRVQFYPALYNDFAPYDAVDVLGIYTFKAWVEHEDRSFDVALLILAQSIGYTVGYHGLACLNDGALRNEKVRVTGYPGDKGGKQMWNMSGRLAKIDSERIGYDIDTYKGQSGGGISISSMSSPYIIGVHTHGGNPHNTGTRLSLVKWQWLVECITATGEVRESQLIIPTASEMHCIMAVAHEELMAQGYIDALAGFPPAQCKIGKELLRHWNGRPQDNCIAIRFLKLAACRGEEEAQNILRAMNLTWDTISIAPEDEYAVRQASGLYPRQEDLNLVIPIIKEEEGMLLYLRAIAGDAGAQAEFCYRVLYNGLHEFNPHIGFSFSDPRKNILAMNWLKLLSRQGDATAQHVLHMITSAKDSELEQLVARLIPLVDKSKTDYSSTPTVEDLNELLTIILAEKPELAEAYLHAESGNPRAQRILGQQLLQSWSHRPDTNRLAVHFLRLAAEQGDVKAQNTLRAMHFNWRKLPPLEQESLEARQTSGEFPSEQDVQFMLSIIKQSETAGSSKEDGWRLYQKAKMHDRNTQTVFGCYLLNGGLNFTALDYKDNATALYWLQLAASLGSVEAREILEEIGSFKEESQKRYLSHKIDIMESEKGLQLYQRSKLNDFNAQTVLACRFLYEMQCGINRGTYVGQMKDDRMVMQWLQTATSLEGKEAQEVLNALNSDVDGQDEGTQLMVSLMKEEEGLSLYQKAQTGDAKAQTILGARLIKIGDFNLSSGIKGEDNLLAIHWLRKAASQGEGEAQNMLRSMNLNWDFSTTVQMLDQFMQNEDVELNLDPWDFEQLDYAVMYVRNKFDIEDQKVQELLACLLSKIDQLTDERGTDVEEAGVSRHPTAQVEFGSFVSRDTTYVLETSDAEVAQLGEAGLTQAQLAVLRQLQAGVKFA